MLTVRWMDTPMPALSFVVIDCIESHGAFAPVVCCLQLCPR